MPPAQFQQTSTPRNVLPTSGPQLADYKFVLVTVERKSNLFFHIQRAWLGAHMRLALTAAGVPGGCRVPGGWPVVGWTVRGVSRMGACALLLLLLLLATPHLSERCLCSSVCTLTGRGPPSPRPSPPPGMPLWYAPPFLPWELVEDRRRVGGRAHQQQLLALPAPGGSTTAPQWPSPAGQKQQQQGVVDPAAQALQFFSEPSTWVQTRHGMLCVGVDAWC